MSRRKRGAVAHRIDGPPNRSDLALPLDVDRLCKAAITVAVGLVLIGVATNLAYTFADRPTDRLQRFLDVNGEGNLPTWFSVVVLTSCGGATWAIAHLHATSGRPAPAAPWYWLTALVALMSLDEMTSLHEGSGHLLRDQAEMPVVGKYAWVVPGAAAAAFVAWVFAVAVRSMPRSRRRPLIFAGGLFIGAALGMEFLEALLLNDGRNYLGRGSHLLTGTQELLEMVGVVLFLRAALHEAARLSTVGASFIATAEERSLRLAVQPHTGRTHQMTGALGADGPPGHPQAG